MKSVTAYLAVGLGTALGSLCRYGVSLGALATLGGLFPWATLLVNALGSMLIAVFATLAAHHPRSAWARLEPLLVAGFCAGFTTFSLFSLEVITLVQRQTWLALAYVLANLALWLSGAALGEWVARAYQARRS